MDKDILERFTTFLAENCSEGKKYLAGKYDKKIADWWLAEMESVLRMKRGEIEDMKKEGDDMPGVDSSFKNMRAHGYNQAVADVLSLLSTPISDKK